MTDHLGCAIWSAAHMKQVKDALLMTDTAMRMLGDAGRNNNKLCQWRSRYKLTLLYKIAQSALATTIQITRLSLLRKTFCPTHPHLIDDMHIVTHP